MLNLTPTDPSGVPQNFTVNSESAYSAIVSWSPPPVEEQNGIIIGYVISVTEDETGDTFQLPVTATVVTINNLRPYHTYTCVIAAETSVGLGPFSAGVSFTTHEDGKSPVFLPEIDTLVFQYIYSSHRTTTGFSLNS